MLGESPYLYKCMKFHTAEYLVLNGKVFFTELWIRRASPVIIHAPHRSTSLNYIYFILFKFDNYIIIDKNIQYI